MARLQQVRIGTLEEIKYPAFVPYDASSPWLIACSGTTLTEGANLVEAVTLQVLSQHKPRQTQCFLYEANPGPHFAQIKRLFAASEQRWGEQLFTVQQCQKKLTHFEELIHRRFALLAQTGAKDIHEYNASVTRVEPIIYLILNGLGGVLSENTVLQQIETLCRQGAIVGITPLILHNTQEETDYNMPAQRHQTLQGFWQSIKPITVGLDLQNPIIPQGIPHELWRLFSRFNLQIGVGLMSKVATDHLLAISQQSHDHNGESDFLQIRIGTVGANPAWFRLGEMSDAYHALIGGATRTGKTTLLNNLILTACEAYRPDQLQLTLMDFKNGVSFWDYNGLAHIADLYAPAEDNFNNALQCLDRFAQQISERYALFRSERVTRLSDYNNEAEPLPRCILFIDEAQSLFEGRDFKQKNLVKQYVSSIAKKGAAAGIHAILSTQSFQNVELEGDVKDQFHLRIGLRHASALGCRALMGRDNDAMLNLPRFTAIYNSHQGEVQYNQTVALDPLENFQGRLDRLKKRFPAAVSSTQTFQHHTSASPHEAMNTKEDINEPW